LGRYLRGELMRVLAKKLYQKQTKKVTNT